MNGGIDSELDLKESGVDWAAIVDEATADDVNKDAKTKPKEDETDKAEETEGDKAKASLKKASEEDSRTAQKANVEKSAAESFA